MTGTELQQWIEQNPLLAIGAIILLSLVLLFIARLVIGRGLTYLARRTNTQYDDILLESLHPYRISWLAPLIFIYALAFLLPEYQSIIETVSLFLIL